LVAFYRETLNQRVVKALPHYSERLRKMRELRATLLKKDTGSHYPGHDGMIYGDILNLIQQARLAMELALAANDPKYYGRTFSSNKQARAFAAHFGRAMSAYTPSIGMKHTLRSMVGEGFISLGIGKTYLAEGLAVAIENDNYIVPGKPFFAPRTVDHFVWDQDVTDFRYCTIFADRYRANYDRLMEDKRTKAFQRNKLHKMGPSYNSSNAEGEAEFNQRDFYGSNNQVTASCYISDTYIPEENLIQTWVVGDDFRPLFDEPLFEIEGESKHPLGPYHFLSLGPTPAGTIPSSPAQNVLNLHNFVQTLFRKLRDQAERSKNITISASGDEEDAERVRETQDGGHATLNDPDSVKELRLDGIDQQIYSMLGTAMSMFDRAAGNPMQRLGLGGSADSATGESIINDQIARLEGHYQSLFHDLLTEVGMELGYMLYMDAATEIPMSREVPANSGIYIDDDWHGAFWEGEDGEEARWGDFDIHEIKPVPFSTRYRPPQQRLAEIDQRVQMLMPLEPLFNQRGKAFNIVRYLELAAELSDTPELPLLWEDIEPPQPDAPSPPSLLAGGGQNEYIHRSVSGSQQGDPMAQLMEAAQVGPNG
jgi:hypothetical protein